MVSPVVALLFALFICAVLIIISMASSISVKDVRIKMLIRELNNNSVKYNILLDDSTKLIKYVTEILNTKDIDNYSYEVIECKKLIERICWRNIRLDEIKEQDGIGW